MATCSRRTVRVIFLGAGASFAADYPLASGLLPAIEATVLSAPGFVNLQNAWTVWRDYRDRAQGLMKTFLTSPNPEVIFSFLDLYDVADEAASRARMTAAKQNETPPPVNESDQSAGALPAREQLLVCLEEFFGFKHHDDGTPDGRSRRNYLRDFLEVLSTDDVVITLNWDTTVERTLAELDRWNPTTGYGFPKPLADPSVGSHPALLDSPVRVLKLHGSFGWYRRPSGLYFADALLDLPRFQLTDPNNNDLVLGPPENRILLYPSFLKQLNDREMLRVWQQADRALREATQVRIVGYSLPRSDGAVRALLHPLRCRADCGEVFIHVSDPNAEARQRWQELLGENVMIDSYRLE